MPDTTRAPQSSTTPSRPSSVVVVGGGPRGAGLLERLLANASELLPKGGLTIHVVEPFPFGTGRIWRWDQSPLLWANSQAEDMTMFTDASSTVEGPVRPGPTFEEWARDVAPGLALPGAAHAEVQSLHGMTFASRRLVHEYLAWFFWRSLDDIPDGVRVQLHHDRVVDVTPDTDRQHGGRHLVHLGGGYTIPADTVLLAQGHLPTVLLGDSAVTATAAHQAGLSYLAEEYTADSDLSVLEPGRDVVVRGAGLAFVDLAVLVGQGRGGRFVTDADGLLQYEPSGKEPVLFVGSRRGVPFRSKITYRLQGPPAPHLRFVDAVAVEALLLRDGELDFRADVWPLLAKELAFGHYHELFAAHPDAVTGQWAQLHTALARLPWGSPDLDEAIAALVPDPADRLDIDAFDRPLRGLTFDDRESLQRHVIDHIEADLARRSDPRYSADLGVFNALLAVLEPLGRVLTSGRLSVESAIRDIPWFVGYFSYFASGPPPQRLREIAALARAGVVRFLGSDVDVQVRPPTRGPQARPAAYVASSPSVPGVVTTATSLVEARVPRTSVSGTADELLGRLFGRGAVAEQVLVDAGGTRRIPTGRLLVDPLTSQVVDAAGLVHPALYAFGSGTSAATPGAFSRPSTNAAFFRQNDASVRKVLADLAVDAQQPVNPAPRTHPRPDHPLFEVVDRDDPALHAYQDALRREANARFASRASTLPSSHSTVIAVRDHADVVVAAGAYEPLEGDRAELAGLWTTPSRRGQGLARALVRELERHAADHGYRRVQAHTGPRVPEAEALLRSEGYIPLTETSEDDGADAACRLRKVLDTAPSADALAPRTVTAAALLGRRRVS